MSSTYYTPVKPAANVDGETADASDVNSVSNAVETAFELLEAQIVAAVVTSQLSAGNGVNISTDGGVTTITIDTTEVEQSITYPMGAVLVERATDCSVAKFVDMIIPSALNGKALSSIIMTCTTAGTTGTMIANVEKNGTDMLSTGVSIDSGETTSVTAATSYVIKTDGTEDVATGDVLTLEITAIHSGTAAKGCSIILEFV